MLLWTVTSVAKFLPKFREQAASEEWGHFSSTPVPAKDIPAPAGADITLPDEDTTALDTVVSSSSSESSDDNSSSELSLITFSWLSPRLGLIHVQRDELLLMPYCR